MTAIARQRAGEDAEAWTAWEQIQRVQAGDKDAFAAIYTHYQHKVECFLMSKCHDRQLAEDLTADTFERALRRIHSFTWQGRDFAAFLITIARNLLMDHRKSKRQRCEFSFAQLGNGGGFHDVDDTELGRPETLVLNEITRSRLVAMFDDLTVEQQQVLRLRFFVRLSVSETAEAMGKGDGAIKALQFRAVQALARLMDEGVDERGPAPTADRNALARRWCRQHGIPVRRDGVVSTRAMHAYERAMAVRS